MGIVLCSFNLKSLVLLVGIKFYISLLCTCIMYFLSIPPFFLPLSSLRCLLQPSSSICMLLSLRTACLAYLKYLSCHCLSLASSPHPSVSGLEARLSLSTLLTLFSPSPQDAQQQYIFVCHIIMCIANQIKMKIFNMIMISIITDFR